ncbi:AAA family ATPase [Clostridium tarantellae]|uniref:AAA domain-containing protein n=1 Tax=Clostridium tarantellae TaxID=39493 RepID=A0A6I1MNI4_9CLOT|nr:AAA family ATPase [Clostridium tarantellae]MPQ43667.1 AAA domain-containing protein [Clostridium tarantellae]
MSIDLNNDSNAELYALEVQKALKDEKEKLIEEKNKLIKREEIIIEKESLLVKKEEDINEKENILNEKEEKFFKTQNEVDNIIIELEEKEKEIKRNEEKIIKKEKVLKIREKNLDKIEEELDERQEEIEEKRKEFKKKLYNCEIEAEKKANEIVESSNSRIKELSDEIRSLYQVKLENELKENELKNKEEIIERLSCEILELKNKILLFERNEELQKNISLEELNNELISTKSKNSDLNKKIIDRENKINELNYLEDENNVLKNTNEILRGRLNRALSQIEYLKRIESSKDTGKDSTGAIFREIIDNQRKLDEKQIPKKYVGDEKFINGFIQFCKEAGFKYKENLVRTFLSSIKSSKLTILKGYSGTGKSSLPELISTYLRAECVTIPVQPNWRTKQDIMGFYNYFTNRFIPTELTRTLIRANINKERIFFVVLDEMNLSRVEYYFSEFNSKIWMSEDKRVIELFEGVGIYDEEVSKYIVDNNINIPDNVFFIGTINEDDSVSPISDKIFDRAQVISFGELPSTISVGNLDLAKNSLDNNEIYTKYNTFVEAYIDGNLDLKSLKILDSVNSFMKDKFNKVIGYRSIKQVSEFINLYVNSKGKEEEALDLQLVSKFIPKLKFIYSEEQIELVKDLEQHIKLAFMEDFKYSEEQADELNIIKEINNIIKEIEG